MLLFGKILSVLIAVLCHLFLFPRPCQVAGLVIIGRRPNTFLGLSLTERTILFLVILVDKTVSVG